MDIVTVTCTGEIGIEGIWNVQNIHSVIAKQKQQDIDTDIPLSKDFRKFVSKLVPVLSTLTRTVTLYSL